MKEFRKITFDRREYYMSPTNWEFPDKGGLIIENGLFSGYEKNDDYSFNLHEFKRERSLLPDFILFRICELHEDLPEMHQITGLFRFE